jgi:hypothetical protein
MTYDKLITNYKYHKVTVNLAPFSLLSTMTEDSRYRDRSEKINIQSHAFHQMHDRLTIIGGRTQGRHREPGVCAQTPHFRF